MTRKAFLGLFAALFLVTGIAEAQDVSLHFYIVPKVDTGFPLGLVPKYVGQMPVPWQAMDYGREDTMLVGANVTAAQHTTITSNLDVTAIPVGLDTNISSAALATVQSKLEGMKIPAQWVTTAITYRQLIGAVGRVFLLMQRFDGLYAKTFFQSGITLDTRINQLTQAQRDSLQSAATALGLDTSFVAGPLLIRQVLKTWIDAMGSFVVMGETF